MSGMRAMKPEEIAVLRVLGSAPDAKYKFTEEELGSLAIQNAASFRVYNAAEKVLEQHKHFMKQAPSREEALRMLVPRQEFQQYVMNVGELFSEYLAFRDVLIEKGLISHDDIDKMVEKRKEDARKRQAEAIKAIETANSQTKIEASEGQSDQSEAGGRGMEEKGMQELTGNPISKEEPREKGDPEK